jgi:hypothetical protein
MSLLFSNCHKHREFGKRPSGIQKAKVIVMEMRVKVEALKNIQSTLKHKGTWPHSLSVFKKSFKSHGG